jgi:hypothetical protein
MQIVYTDNRLIITADCDSVKRQTRPLVRDSAAPRSLQMSDSNKNLVLRPAKTDWPTYRQS